jgi:mono/diheme cytochrome c family protein/cytochrome c553
MGSYAANLSVQASVRFSLSVAAGLQDQSIMKKSLVVIALILGVTHLANASCEISERDLTFDKLVKALKSRDCEIKSIDDLIGKLPVSMRTNPVLMYRSQSLQDPHKTDFQNPRALLKSESPERQIVVTFNGSPSQKNYRNLEVLEINKAVPAPSAEIFRYFDIEFAADSEAEVLSWEQAQAKIKVSNANPSKCVACHGQPARPIFAGYPLWPGAYGSFHLNKNQDEETQLKKFVNSPQSRYRHLKITDFENGRQNFGMSVLSGHFNLSLNATLANANGLRIARLARATRDYDAYRFALIGGALKCDGFLDFVPPLLRTDLDRGVEALLSRSVAAKNPESIFQSILKEGPNQFGSAGFGTLYDPATLQPIGFGSLIQGKPALRIEDILISAKKWAPTPTLYRLFADTLAHQGRQRSTPVSLYLRYILESRGVPMSDWFMDLKRPGYRLMDGTGGGEYIGWALLKDDPTLQYLKPKVDRALGTYESADIRDGYKIDLCKDLKALSVKALAGKREAPANVAREQVLNKNYPSVFKNTCVVCHVKEEIGPRIPFDDEQSLRDWLRDPVKAGVIRKRLFGPKEQRMPPTRELTEPERAELEAFLR